MPSCIQLWSNCLCTSVFKSLTSFFGSFFLSLGFLNRSSLSSGFVQWVCSIYVDERNWRGVRKSVQFYSEKRSDCLYSCSFTLKIMSNKSILVQSDLYVSFMFKFLLLGLLINSFNLAIDPCQIIMTLSMYLYHDWMFSTSGTGSVRKIFLSHHPRNKLDY